MILPADIAEALAESDCRIIAYDEYGEDKFEVVCVKDGVEIELHFSHMSIVTTGWWLHACCEHCPDGLWEAVQQHLKGTHLTS